MDSTHLPFPSAPFPSGTGEHAAAVTRIAERHWHALEDDEVVGRAEVSRRPDGRLFLSVDAWHGAVFDQLAYAMLAELPRPLYTVVDEADLDLIVQWERAGFAPRRREWEYVVPTDPRLTGLGAPSSPDGVTVLALGEADGGLLHALDSAIHDEIEATVGWHTMPAEVLSGPDGRLRPRPANYAVAVAAGHYVGLVRVTPLPRQPRIGLIAVRSDHRRRGIARLLLAEVLGWAHQRGNTTASADVHQSNSAAIALFEGAGATRTSSNLELVLR
ncbi:GNAT family N-acetyltransferase [Hamadaea tsunoensis]|uniref:GNAT family N-acetyltransferase n=1 Tax=Hamadaea tsunoensis TaxID=53368 RepID=UPI0003FF0475|nr:GNAT family N-acetyltransferase [Hamadaea tsunoensis]